MVIGFIGLGAMGSQMAHNLIKSGERVYVYDVVSELMTNIEKAGGIPCQSPQELAKKVEMVIISVQTGEQVSDLCVGTHAIFKHLKAGSYVIDCSSIDIQTTKLLHTKAHEYHLKMLDAPVSGGVKAATAGTLTIMVGGDKTDFEIALPILNKIGKKIIYAGSAGLGQAAKICNNLLLGISMVGVCEAFSLAKKLGLDEKKFFEISSNASGQCWAMTSYCPVPNIIENVPSNQQYLPGFKAKMMLKDLRLGENAAKYSGALIPLGEKTAALYASFVEAGYGEIDFSAIIKLIAAE